MNDYEIEYNKFWKEIIEKPDGSINKDQLMRELSDYSDLISNASRVYCEITNNKISKANTLPENVIAIYQDVVTEFCDAAHNEGFQEAIDLVLNLIANQDSNRLPTIESLKDDIVEEVELYLTDG
jgi:hypothetical protein